VDGAQQATVIKFLVVSIKSNADIFTLVGGVSEFLSYVDLVTIRNSECIAVYGNTIVDSIVCAQSATALLKSVCKVSS
jgi:hypothetical protein